VRSGIAAPRGGAASGQDEISWWSTKAWSWRPNKTSFSYWRSRSRRGRCFGRPRRAQV